MAKNKWCIAIGGLQVHVDPAMIAVTDPLEIGETVTPLFVHVWKAYEYIADVLPPTSMESRMHLLCKEKKTSCLVIGIMNSSLMVLERPTSISNASRKTFGTSRKRTSHPFGGKERVRKWT